MPTDNDKRCIDCHDKLTAISQRVDKLEGRLSYVEKDQDRNLREVKEHMRNEENSFDKIFGEIRKIDDKLTGIVTTALKDHNDMEREFTNQLQRYDETSRQRFVTKNEVRVGWFVATAVLAGSVWFFTYNQGSSTKAQFDRMITKIVKEIKK